MHFDLIDLKFFVLVVESGGIAAASRRANISVSALSERIKTMEIGAGVELFQRGAKGSRPTQAGLELVTHARAVLLQAERLSGAVSAWKNQERGSIRLRANSNAIASFLPEMLARYLSHNPEVTVDLIEQTSDEIARALRAGDADIGIAASNADLSGLDVRPFRSDQLVLLVHAGHQLSGERSVGFSDVLLERFIGLEKDFAIQQYLAKHAERHGHVLDTRVRLKSFESVCRMVAAGAGVAVVPLSAVPTAAFDNGALAIALTDAWSKRDLMLCLPSDRSSSTVVIRLVQEITADPAVRFGGIGRLP